MDGKGVKQIREMLGETQAQFAARFGYGQTQISKWESGKLSISTVQAMAIRSLERSIMEIKNATIPKY